MHLAIYLSLNAFYFLFGVLLVNTIRKEFFKQAENKVLLKLVKNNIFIPDSKNKNNYYLNEILKLKKHPEYIYIFPESNRLVNLDEFWGILKHKYYRHLNFLHNFVVPIYDLDNYTESRRLESDIYTHSSFPLVFMLRKKKGQNKIFTVKQKKEAFDMMSYCRDNQYHLIQRINDDICRAEKKIFLLETYLVLIRRPPEEKKTSKIEMYRYKNIRYMLLSMETNQLTNCPNMSKLFETGYFSGLFDNINKYIDLGYKFIHKNFKSEFMGMYQDLQSTCFEILSVKYVMNSKFQTFLYEINRDVELYGGLDAEVFEDLINQVHLCVKLQGEYDTDKLISISV